MIDEGNEDRDESALWMGPRVRVLSLGIIARQSSEVALDGYVTARNLRLASYRSLATPSINVGFVNDVFPVFPCVWVMRFKWPANKSSK